MDDGMQSITTDLGTWHPRKIALLKGGWNSEREVSLSSAKEIAVALDAKGFDVLEIDVTQDIALLISQLKTFNPDVVFMNALHGRFVEDGCLQGLLEMLGYPYTASNVLGSALGFDKAAACAVMKSHELPIPNGKSMSNTDCFESGALPMEFPFVIKPTREGSSVGVFIVKTQEDFDQARAAWTFGAELMVEEYIPGRELSIPLLKDKALGILELKPKRGFYDYEAKYTDGIVDHIYPADIDADDYKEALALCEKAARVLRVEGVSRADIRYDESRPKGSRVYLLEINTQPGMTPLSIVPDVASHVGYDYETLCEWMVKNPIWPEGQKPLRGALSEPLQNVQVAQPKEHL